MIPPALRDAGDDPLLRGAPIAVLVWLWSRLDVYRPEPVKIEAVAWALRMQRQSVGRALSVLCQRGYLEEGPQRERLRTFRLRVNRHTRLDCTG